MFTGARKQLKKELEQKEALARQRGDHPIANILRHAAKDVGDWI